MSEMEEFDAIFTVIMAVILFFVGFGLVISACGWITILIEYSERIMIVLWGEDFNLFAIFSLQEFISIYFRVQYIIPAIIVGVVFTCIGLYGIHELMG